MIKAPHQTTILVTARTASAQADKAAFLSITKQAGGRNPPTETLCQVLSGLSLSVIHNLIFGVYLGSNSKEGVLQ